MTEDITLDHLKELDIKKIALDRDKFGPLTFEESYPLLEKLQILFIELSELGYLDKLIPEEINKVNNNRNHFARLVDRLQKFDMQVDQNFKVTRDNFEMEVRSLYNRTFVDLREILVYLRQEASQNKDTRLLQKERGEVQQVLKEAEQIKKSLSYELQDLKKNKEAIESERGALPSAYLGVEFKKQSGEFEKQSKEWGSGRIKALNLLTSLVVFNVLLYSVGLFMDSNFIEKVFSSHYFILVFALVSILVYNLGFATKNYNIYSNLLITSNHRYNVAETMNRFLGTNPPPEDRSEIIKQK
ncbi:hypothetical protein KKC45_02320 [Patescibacteria group bacterium]|nr:hypothetical protein [Patescibacteria group bacterium]